jgi:hypothetical protein
VPSLFGLHGDLLARSDVRIVGTSRSLTARKDQTALARVPPDVDLFLASADGDFGGNLTADQPGFLIPVTWR